MVIALFFAIWPLYFMPWLAWRSQAVDVLVPLQMLLTFPAQRAWRLLVRTSGDMAGKDDFDLMART